MVTIRYMLRRFFLHSSSRDIPVQHLRVFRKVKIAPLTWSDI